MPLLAEYNRRMAKGNAIVDAHLHVWDPRTIRYPWLDDIPLLNRPYLLSDYDAACRPIEVERMVFVQAEADFSRYKEETAWVSDLARQDRRLQGIVSWAPLEKGAAALPELEALAANRLVKGIRRIIQFEPDIDFCLRVDFIAGVRLLSRFGLGFDICINHRQMENTIKFVRACPEVRFILDHIGKPDIKGGTLEPWKTHLRELSRMANVWCKMSGLVTEADHAAWTREDLKPYIDHVVDCFGFDRLAFGGDWPVALQATVYPRWIQTLEWVVKGCSEDEKAKLFHDNAIIFYRLGA